MHWEVLHPSGQRIMLESIVIYHIDENVGIAIHCIKSLYMRPKLGQMIASFIALLHIVLSEYHLLWFSFLWLPFKCFQVTLKHGKQHSGKVKMVSVHTLGSLLMWTLWRCHCYSCAICVLPVFYLGSLLLVATLIKLFLGYKILFIQWVSCQISILILFLV